MLLEQKILNPEGSIYNASSFPYSEVLQVNTCLDFFYTTAFMQWFTEFMELFLPVQELIKTSN